MSMKCNAALSPESESSTLKCYERGINKLIEIVKRMHVSTWSPTKGRKDIEAIASKLEEIVKLLHVDAWAQEALETFHRDRGRESFIDLDKDGYAFDRPLRIEWASYKSIVFDVRELAESAQLAAKDLPDPRTKPALPFAARGLLHLRCHYGFGRPALSDNSDEVVELKRVCVAAGMALSNERYRGALAESLKEFDPFLMATEYDDLFQ